MTHLDKLARNTDHCESMSSGVWNLLRNFLAIFVALLTYVPSIATIAHACEPGSTASFGLSHLTDDSPLSSPFDESQIPDTETSPPSPQMSEVETDDHLNLSDLAAYYAAPTEVFAIPLNHRLEGVVLPLTRKPPEVA